MELVRKVYIFDGRSLNMNYRKEWEGERERFSDAAPPGGGMSPPESPHPGIVLRTRLGWVSRHSNQLHGLVIKQTGFTEGAGGFFITRNSSPTRIKLGERLPGRKKLAPYT